MLFSTKKHSGNHAVVELPKEALRDSLVAAQITFKRYANPDTSGSERPGHLQVASAPVVRTEASLPKLRHPEPRTVHHQDLREALPSRTEPASVPTTPLGVSQGRVSNLPGYLGRCRNSGIFGPFRLIEQQTISGQQPGSGQWW